VGSSEGSRALLPRQPHTLQLIPEYCKNLYFMQVPSQLMDAPSYRSAPQPTDSTIQGAPQSRDAACERSIRWQGQWEFCAVYHIRAAVTSVWLACAPASTQHHKGHMLTHAYIYVDLSDATRELWSLVPPLSPPPRLTLTQGRQVSTCNPDAFRGQLVYHGTSGWHR
jgi:hypothetical protein